MIAYFTYHSLSSATHPGIQDAPRLAFDARGSLPARQTSRTRKTDQSAPMGQSIEVILGIQELQLVNHSINIVANSSHSSTLNNE